MKRVIKLNKFNLICYLLLIIIHLLVLTRIIPKEVLWDNNLKDYKSLILSETFAIGIITTLLFYYNKALRIFKKHKNPKALLIVLKLLLFYSVLELIGSFIGYSFIFKSFSIPIYLTLLLVTYLSLTSIKLFISKNKKLIDKI